MRILAVSLLLAVLITGCASYTVKKVPDIEGYELATDCTDNPNKPCRNELQRQGDSLRGFRYYLPRPFVLVKQEFPVAGGSFLVPGVVDASGRLLSVDNLPAELTDIFGSSSLIPLDRARRPMEESPAASTTALQAGGSGAAEGAGEAQVKAQLLQDENNLLDKSSASSAEVLSKDEFIKITAKVSKDLEAKLDLGEQETLLADRIFLVPIRAGKHALEGLVELKLLIPATGSAGADRTLVGQVQGKDVPSFASIGVAIDFVKDGKKHRTILHRKGRDTLNEFAGSSGSSGGASEPKDEAKKDEEKKSEGKKDDEAEKTTGGELKGSTSGDPATDPLVYKGSLYDILLLPDQTQQFAIHVRPGIGKASIDFGAENGWMLEKAGVDIDNTNIGKLVTDAIAKVVDAGITDLFDLAVEVEEAADQPEATATELQSAGASGAPAVVRIDFVKVAVPGLYPLLSPREQGCHAGGVGKCAPRVDYATRSTYVVTVVGLPPAASQDTPGQQGNTDEKEADLKRIITASDTYAGTEDITNLFEGGTVAICEASVSLAQDGSYSADVEVNTAQLIDGKNLDTVEKLKTKFVEAIKKAAVAPGIDLSKGLSLTFRECS